MEMEAGRRHCFLDCQSGEVLFLGDEDTPAIGAPTAQDLYADPKNYLAIPAADPEDALLDMYGFVATLTDPRLRESLDLALNAPGPALRFKNVLQHLPEQRAHWHSFRMIRAEQRARIWLAEHHLEPAAAG